MDNDYTNAPPVIIQPDITDKNREAWHVSAISIVSLDSEIGKIMNMTDRFTANTESWEDKRIWLLPRKLIPVSPVWVKGGGSWLWVKRTPTGEKFIHELPASAALNPGEPNVARKVLEEYVGHPWKEEELLVRISHCLGAIHTPVEDQQVKWETSPIFNFMVNAKEKYPRQCGARVDKLYRQMWGLLSGINAR